MIEQICAKQKRQLFRVNITELTDEDDLLGGMRLVNGNTVWQDGAVVKAMECGGVLLLDEVDLGSHKIMCLQPVLEGKGVFLKKINKWIRPVEGFTILATANTKGKGSDDGRFVGTNILNEAFLDRFDFTYEQEYAPRGTEKRILIKKMEAFGKRDNDFADALTRWSETIRKAFYEGAVSEIISTRRLEAIAKLYAVLEVRMVSIERALSRFDTETKTAFMNFYTKIDPTINGDAPVIEKGMFDPNSGLSLAEHENQMKQDAANNA
jgi:MoxR-like ATPase